MYSQHDHTRDSFDTTNTISFQLSPALYFLSSRQTVTRSGKSCISACALALALHMLRFFIGQWLLTTSTTSESTHWLSPISITHHELLLLWLAYQYLPYFMFKWHHYTYSCGFLEASYQKLFFYQQQSLEGCLGHEEGVYIAECFTGNKTVKG